MIIVCIKNRPALSGRLAVAFAKMSLFVFIYYSKCYRWQSSGGGGGGPGTDGSGGMAAENPKD